MLNNKDTNKCQIFVNNKEKKLTKIDDLLNSKLVLNKNEMLNKLQGFINKNDNEKSFALYEKGIVLESDNNI